MEAMVKNMKALFDEETVEKRQEFEAFLKDFEVRYCLRRILADLARTSKFMDFRVLNHELRHEFHLTLCVSILFTSPSY